MNKLIRTLSISFLLLQSISLCAQTNLGWLQRAEFAGPARHRASAAAVGNRGYMGLGHINSVVDILFDDWFEYDPGSDTWTQKASYPGGPRFHAATFVVNNKVYVGTGRDVSTTLHSDFWCYDPVTNSWSGISPYPGAPRRGAVAFTLNGKGYVGTGSYHSNFFKYDPVTDTWSPVANLPGSGRISAVGFAINGKGYVTTGDETGPMGDIWEYDPTFDTWTAKAPLPGLPRMEAGGFALDGKGYVGCGDDFSSGTNYEDFWCFNPVTNSWLQVANFGGSARRYLSAFVIGNRAFAGLGTSGINYADLWEFGFISDVHGNAAATLTTFPVPMTTSCTLRFGEMQNDVCIDLVNLEGKVIETTEHFSGTEFLLERKELVNGIYFLRITSEDRPPMLTKLIIQ